MANTENFFPASIHPAARRAAPIDQSGRIAPADSSAGRILVADDDPDIRQLISDYFGQHGMQTVSAAERAAVTRQLADGETSAIILDLHLGQDDGLDLLREIRSGSDVPVIIMTGRSHDVVDCIVRLELGVDDYLTKPFGVPNCMPGSAPGWRHENGRRLRARLRARRPNLRMAAQP
jgi:CheY-like chemotaxis protein